MCRKIVFILITSCFFFGQSIKAQTITLAYVDFPPYEYIENDKPEGILVGIVESIFKQAGVPLNLKFFPFKRAYETAKTNEIAGLFNFYKTEERLGFFDYTEPIIKNPLVFFVRKDSTLNFNTLKDLKGLKIGVMNGYTYGTDFDESTLFTKDPVTTHESNFKKLTVGRIDAYPCDKLVGIHIARQNGLMSELKILPVPLKIMDGYIGFSKGKHQDLISKINKIIIKMQQNGEIESAIDKYIEKNI